MEIDVKSRHPDHNSSTFKQEGVVRPTLTYNTSRDSGGGVRYLIARFLAVQFLCSMAFTGCFIKDDRGECPCHLLIDMTSIDTSRVDSLVLIGVYDGIEAFYKTIHSDEFSPEYELLTPRTGNLHLKMLSNVSGFNLEGESLLIPFGMECPPVYMDAEVLDCECETLRMQASLNKNYCRLAISLVDGQDFPFFLSVRGCVDGYLYDGSPSEGNFSSPVLENPDGEYTVLLPRQLDGSLTLDIDDVSDVLKSFALGEILNGCGYDWTAPDLEDITLSMDYSLTNMTIKIQNWDKVYEFDFII